MNNLEFVGKPSAHLLRVLENAPADRAVSILMRHSIRYPIRTPEETLTAGLTPEGFALAEAWGRAVRGSRQLNRLVASPVGRCIDTANSISRAAGWQREAVTEPLLLKPVPDAVIPQLPGIASGALPVPPEMLAFLRFLLPQGNTPGSLDLIVAHDATVSLVTAVLFGEILTPTTPGWPDFLEGILLWRDGDDLFTGWRGRLDTISLNHGGRFTGVVTG